MNQELPPGYRATWAERHVLAKAKLQPEIRPTTVSAEFAGILARDGGGTANSDFIEVHIFGAITRNTIESVHARKPKTKEDRVIWNKMARSMSDMGIGIEID